MNKKACSLLVLAPTLWLAPSLVNASPLVSIGDNADLFFNGSSSLRWTSNLFRNENNEVSDLIFTVTPGFEFNVGRGMSNADFSVITSYDILTYADRTKLNTGLFHLKALGSYQDSRWDLNGSASYDEYQSASGNALAPGSQRLVESDASRVSGRGEYQFSPKFSFALGANYVDYRYQNDSKLLFSDYTNLTLPADLYYELTPKLDLSVGYRYGDRSVQDRTDELDALVPGYNTKSHFLNVGARGELLPKLTGFFKVGYTGRDSDRPGSSNNGIMGLDGDLTWATTVKLTNVFTFSRDFGVGGEGDATEVTALGWNGIYSINTNWSASANARYTHRDYVDGFNNGSGTQDRKDNQYQLGARGSYMLNSYWSFSGGYTYRKNDSNVSGYSYNDHSIDVRASLRY